MKRSWTTLSLLAASSHPPLVLCGTNYRVRLCALSSYEWVFMLKALTLTPYGRKFTWIVIQQMHYFIKLSRSRVISPMRWLMFSYLPSVFFPRCTIWQPSNGDSALMTHSGNGWGCWRNIHWEDRPTQQLSGLVKTGSVSSVAPQIWYRSCDTHHKFLS